ncbi:MAG: gamma-glutamyltransferase [Pseudomonadota bacterium]|nr:gamma-glutamyltransferase [Pseudomonadota bacterium]
MSARGAVAAGDPATAGAAQEILEAGGNAFDAVLAAMCASCVAEPGLVTLGGGGFLMARPEGEAPRLYDFFCQTPKHCPDDRRIDFKPITVDFGALQIFNTGTASMAVPGTIKGLVAIHRDLGSMPLSDIVAPAQRLASEGVALAPVQAAAMAMIWPVFASSHASTKLMQSPSRPGEPPRTGERLALPGFADALGALATDGDDIFYRGEMGRALIEHCRDHGGLLTRADLESYSVHVRKPLSQRFGDATVFTNPPPSMGGARAVFALSLLEKRLEHCTFGKSDHLDALANSLIAMERAQADDDRCGFMRGTTHMNVIDRHGNAAALSLTFGQGSGYVVPGTGILINNMMGETDLNPHAYGAWNRDRRLASSMMPSLVLWEDGRELALGSGGSKRIRSAVMQTIANIIAFGLPLADAVRAPRLHADNEDGILHIEPGFAPEALAGLDGLMPNIRRWPERALYFGGVHAVAANPHTDAFDAVGDPRRGGAAIVVD